MEWRRATNPQWRGIGTTQDSVDTTWTHNRNIIHTALKHRCHCSDTVVLHSASIGPGLNQHWINNGNIDSTLQTLNQHWFNIDSTLIQHRINIESTLATLIQHWVNTGQPWFNIESTLNQCWYNGKGLHHCRKDKTLLTSIRAIRSIQPIPIYWMKTGN